MQRSISSADIILNFLEVSTHVVLYELKFYQPEIFEQQQIYGLPVFQSRHQDVNAYIDRFFSNSRALIEAGLVRKVIFNILDSFVVFLDDVFGIWANVFGIFDDVIGNHNNISIGIGVV